MMQSNVAPKYKQIPKYHHNKKSNLNLKLINNDRRRHLKSAHKRLLLNQIEKNVLIAGIVIITGLMFILIGTKITNDVYQNNVIKISTSVSRFHNLNNDSRQKISDLQNNDRLQKVAHRTHLRFSSNDVRNVK